MRDEDYIVRLAEKTLQRKLNSSGCVLVTGPKFCGKSTMCERYASSVTALKTTNAIKLANADPSSALIGKKPHLVDEWQKAPEIWNIIKDDLDKDYQFGKYILTGSTTPVNNNKIQHSGAGRIAQMVLRPFSLYESKESNGLISLETLFSNNFSNTSFMSGTSENGLLDVAFYVCRGGWPIALKAKKEYAIDVTKNYFDSLFVIENENDDFAYFFKNKNVDLLKTILKSFARNISTEAKNTSMIKDIIESGYRAKLDDDTFLSYEKMLKDLFLIYDLPAWNLNLRTTVAVRVSPTHHFYDPSIAAAALGITPADLINDLNTFGFFFEDLVIRDLSIYAEFLGGSLKHYRDSAGQEVDAIVELENGDYCAIEIKIGSEENIQKGINSLISFDNKLQKNSLKLPKFKMVITSHGSCYKDSESGIYIVPITMLKN